MTRGACVVMAGLALFGALSPGAAQELPEGVTPDMVTEGKQIYNGVGLCMACHGPDGSGLVGPDLTDDEWYFGTGTYEEIVARIVEGVSADEAKNPMGTIMPARGGSAINDEQVDAVAAYVWTLSRSETDGR